MDNYQIISKFISDHKYLEEHIQKNRVRGMSISSELIPVGYSSLMSFTGQEKVIFSPSEYFTSNDLNGFSMLRRNGGTSYLICINNDHIPLLKEQIMRYGMNYSWDQDLMNTIELKVFRVIYEVPLSTYKQSPTDLKAKLKEIENNIDTYRNRLLKNDTVTTESTVIEQPLIL